MSDASRSARTLTTLTDGSRWAILAGIPFLALAAYFFFTPLSLTQSDGGFFYCGSAASPNVEAARTCSSFEDSHRLKALASLGAGLGVPLAGLGLFGVTRRPEHEEIGDDLRRGEQRRGATLLDDEVAEGPQPPRGRLGRPQPRTGRHERDEGIDADDDLDDDFDEPQRRPRAHRRPSDDWDDEGR